MQRYEVSDLIDAVTVAKLLGLSQRTAVSVYAARYADMPRPVIDLGPGRPRLWSRKAIVRWQKKRVSVSGNGNHYR